MRELGESLPRDLLRLLGSADLLELERRQLMRAQAMLSSMTRREREHPEILNSSRRDRIARGSGTSHREVDDLVRDFLLLKRKVARLLRGAGGE